MIGVAVVSRSALAPDGSDRQRLFLTIENIGVLTVVEFQADISVNGTDWERLPSVSLRNDLRSFERMPPQDFEFGPYLRLTIRKNGISVDPRRTLYFDLDELQIVEATDPKLVRVRYCYRNLDGTRFESPELSEFALVTEVS